MTAGRWSLAERRADLERAEREGLDLLVIGGGITGAGVLRDAASRGLRSFLVERNDFASGTSSRSSKLIHGGLRYIGEGQLRMTREACRERDRLLELHPNLVRPLPFLFPAYVDTEIPYWQVRSALWIYAALANFRPTSRFRMLTPEEVAVRAPRLRTDGLVGAGLYWDAQVDDARLVLETLKSARALGGAAVNHTEAVEFQRSPTGRLTAARVRDSLGGRTFTLRAHVIVNAAGPAVERVRGLDVRGRTPELRPAKGVHLVLPRRRLPTDVAITFVARDGRHLFVAPWDDLLLVGTTDRFSREIDEPVVTIEEVHYLLHATNLAFPGLGLTTNDLVSVFAGVRPLAASEDEDAPSSSVSREHRIYRDASGLISAVGGKLTTYRAMGERIVGRALRLLPAERRRAAGPSRTATLPLRDDGFDRHALEAKIRTTYAVNARRAEHLVRFYGRDAPELLAEALPEQRGAIGDSRYTLAEIPWALRRECAVTLCDLLERRLRMAIFAPGQGLPELAEIAGAAAREAGWDDEQTRAEMASYAEAVSSRYQIIAPGAQRAA